jgi:SAM-dependent methyltransferase
MRRRSLLLRNVATVRAVGTDAPKLLNLACGDQAHPEWTNVELWPHSIRYDAPLLGWFFRRLDAKRTHLDSCGVPVRFADLRDGIPYPGESFDVVYHSNFLEHLDRAGAERLLRECRRVLRPGGLLRVVVPDLELQARAYLAALDEARAGQPGAADRHRWALVELYDQVTRRTTGGEMQAWMDAGWPWEPTGAPTPISRPGHETPSPKTRFKWALIGEPTPERTGELHRSAWDSQLLAGALVEAGFHGPVFLTPEESGIPGWERYRLDSGPAGRPRHFDCLYAEAVRTEDVSALSRKGEAGHVDRGGRRG